MEISRETFDKIATLARLEFDEKEVEKLMTDMSSIITWVEKLKEVDTEGVVPLSTMSQETNVLNEDKIEPHLSQKEVLSNSPKKDDNYFLVPDVMKT